MSVSYSGSTFEGHLCVSQDLSASILEQRGSPQLGHAAVMVKWEETLASCALALEASAQIPPLIELSRVVIMSQEA